MAGETAARSRMEQSVDVGGVLLQLMRRYAAHGTADRAALTVEDVLAGRGHNGTGVASP